MISIFRKARIAAIASLVASVVTMLIRRLFAAKGRRHREG